MCIHLDEAPGDVQVPCNAFVTCRWSSASGCVGLDADVLQKPCFALKRAAHLGWDAQLRAEPGVKPISCNRGSSDKLGPRGQHLQQKPS